MTCLQWNGVSLVLYITFYFNLLSPSAGYFHVFTLDGYDTAIIVEGTDLQLKGREKNKQDESWPDQFC